ncbi:MAG: DUF479 domain-containing protein [Rhodocyclaceae bacterium]|nr:MAG: DUF479 domain-containing protein [Rhodocyclaceae bacterium]
MNFLAHLYLAGEEEHYRLGGLMGDFVKGPLPGALPDDLARGVMLHRRIDSYADAHPAFRRSRERMSPLRRRYGGILVDMFYDHLLARLWPRFHAAPLVDFAGEAYALLRRREASLPEGMVGVAKAMAAGDWLSSYAEMEAIALALARMGTRRLRVPNSLAGGEAELLADYAGFEADFLAFMADAVVFSAGVRTGRV